MQVVNFASAGRISQRHHATPSRLLRLEALEDRRMLSARAVSANNAFAIDVYEHLQNEEGNLFFSPLSLSTALTMSYAGAGGQTAAEMEQVLHLGSEPGIHQSFNQLITSIEETDLLGDYELSTANAIWPRDTLTVGQGFIDTVSDEYSGLVQPLDFSDLQAVEDTINDWVSDQTRGKIEDLVKDLDPVTQMVLTNAIYFRGQWDLPFDPRFTSDQSFETADGESIMVPTMFTQLTTGVTTIDGFQVVDMPIAQDRASMVIVLPPTNGPVNLTSELLDDIGTWLDGPQFAGLYDVYLPKFQTTVSMGLKGLLSGMGMPSAFTGNADFSGIAPGLFISRVVHKADIEVNEQGTEAAAATEIDFAICFAEGTPVLTPDGEKPIEELAAGDYVLARDEFNVEGPVQPKLVEKRMHGLASIVAVHVGGRVIRTTEAHPFFVYGKGWIPASELQQNDRLSTNHGDWTRVDRVETTEEAVPVYNLRVSDHRTYFVGSKNWGFGVWVHNGYSGELRVDRPFHFMIRDNQTSTISFMGRIDDPTQTENEFDPSVSQVSADFDEDGDTDGADFLAWQRGYGSSYTAEDLETWEASVASPVAATSADFNQDGDVDGSDYLASQRGRGILIDATLADGDSDSDGDVDALDQAAWHSAYGQLAASVAAPALDAVVSWESPDSSASEAADTLAAVLGLSEELLPSVFD